MRFIISSIAVVLAFTSAGCQSSTNQSSVVDQQTSNTSFVMATEPAGAVPVGDARGASNDGEEVIVLGVIGGSTKPFVEGMAAFTIVDPKVPYCADEEGCPTPWDYCCEVNAVKQNIATVKFVDETGKPIAKEARELLPVKELSTVVVKGTAERDEQGNLTIAASHIFVRAGGN
ncbi:MAG TPA: hypothetical protein PKD64_03945 [Pirellulaceae bacterium]|nr:hypothetical protein [Pirellulaceae bacterium]HMO91323.1 hypothetical protein [Pirellulaceae bacterium]HMP70142.1 hypothetical protein [Pirellulaceae bacterium]